MLMGTVCERYMLLPNDKKQMIAGELDRSVREIERKISVSDVSKYPVSRLIPDRTCAHV